MPKGPNPLNLLVARLGISVRSTNTLRQIDVVTLGDLARWSRKELLNLKCFGETCLNEVRELLGAYGLALRGESPHVPLRKDLGVREWFSEFAKAPERHPGWPTWLLDLCPLTQEWLERRQVYSIADLMSHRADDLWLLGLVEGTSHQEMLGHLDEIRIRLAAFKLSQAQDLIPKRSFQIPLGHAITWRTVRVDEFSLRAETFFHLRHAEARTLGHLAKRSAEMTYRSREWGETPELQVAGLLAMIHRITVPEATGFTNRPTSTAESQIW